MSKLRFRVVETAFKKKAATVETPAERPSEYFAKYVFNREKMFKYLPGAVYAKLTDAMDNGAPLERAIADEVAAGMKRWATELGVAHYSLNIFSEILFYRISLYISYLQIFSFGLNTHEISRF